MRIGAGEAVAGHRDENDLLADGAERVVGEAELFEHVGAIVLDHDVGHRDEAQHELAAFRLGEVDGAGVLVAIVGIEVGGLVIDALVFARAEEAERAKEVPRARRLDLDHLGADIAEEARAVGPGPDAREIEDADAVQRHAQH